MGESEDRLKGKATQVMRRATKHRRMEAEGARFQASDAARGVAKETKRALKRASR